MDERAEFVKALAEVSNAKDMKQLEQIITKLGESKLTNLYKQFKSDKKGLKKLYDSYMNNIQFAQLGAKLDYINRLNGKCPEGYEIESFSKGGCVKCKKAQKSDVIERFKSEKCGGKMKKKKKEDGGTLNCSGGKVRFGCGGKAKKKTSKKEDGGRVSLKKSTYKDNEEMGEVQETRHWSDGTTSERISTEGGTVYIGRDKRKVGITNVPNDKQNFIADSLRITDWSKKTAPKLKKRKFGGIL